MKALVLSGGGGFGAYQVGAWQALAEARWRPDVVLGTSIGAVNGFLISRSFGAEELRRVWLEMPAQLAAVDGAANGFSGCFPIRAKFPASGPGRRKSCAVSRPGR